MNLLDLEAGWDSYGAPPPDAGSVASAESFAAECKAAGLSPFLAPSVIGGVGVTITNGSREAYVEFLNGGSGTALLSDEINDDPDAMEFVPWPLSPPAGIVERIKAYLGG